jgi:hypothetical protein
MELLSLFEYLGNPAGQQLGKDVAQKAKELKIPFNTKEIKTKNYKGIIHIYPRHFLDKYFNKTIITNNQSDELDDLPF